MARGYIVIPVAQKEDGKVEIGDVSIPDAFMQAAPDVLWAVTQQVLRDLGARQSQPAPAAAGGA